MDSKYTKKQLVNLGFRFELNKDYRYVKIAFPGWSGNYRDELRVQLQNGNTQFVINRACQYGWNNGVDHLAVFKMYGTGFKKIRKVFNDGRKVINRYQRTDSKYADMIAQAIFYAKNMLKGID